MPAGLRDAAPPSERPRPCAGGPRSASSWSSPATWRRPSPVPPRPAPPGRQRGRARRRRGDGGRRRGGPHAAARRRGWATPGAPGEFWLDVEARSWGSTTTNRSASSPSRPATPAPTSGRARSARTWWCGPRARTPTRPATRACSCPACSPTTRGMPCGSREARSASPCRSTAPHRRPTRPRGPGAYRGWDPAFRLYVGDAADGNRPWRGQVRRLEAGAGDIGGRTTWPPAPSRCPTASGTCPSGSTTRSAGGPTVTRAIAPGRRPLPHVHAGRRAAGAVVSSGRRRRSRSAAGAGGAPLWWSPSRLRSRRARCCSTPATPALVDLVTSRPAASSAWPCGGRGPPAPGPARAEGATNSPSVRNSCG